LRPRITVVGVGGAGGNAVANMIRAKLEGVDFLVANTDAQSLAQSLCQRRIQLGAGVTKGLGAGARPDIGRASAEEALSDITEQLSGANMCFITAGMGGGTGTGAAPVIAQLAREQGILTVGVVTKPFHFEGTKRMRMAEMGIQELSQHVDTLIVIPNQNLFRIANEKTTFADAFRMADEVLHMGVRGVTDLMTVPGLINLDFADVKTIMNEMGKAMMGTGEAGGENRATAAAEAAISNPLLDDVSMKGARSVLINITGGPDLTLFEVDEAAHRIREEVDPEANIIVGSTTDNSLEGKIRISVVATGIDQAVAQQRPPLSLVTPQAAAERPQENAITIAPPLGAISMPQMVAQSVMATAIQQTPVHALQGATALAMEPVIAPAPAMSIMPAASAPVETPLILNERMSAPAAHERPTSPGVQAPEKKRSLFGRVTSRLTGHREMAPAAQDPQRKIEPAMQARSRVHAEHAETAPKAAPSARRAEPAQQPQLAFESPDRVSIARAEEDMLDIPAFLRRQAN
jgi:cell division protein FtsZ